MEKIVETQYPIFEISFDPLAERRLYGSTVYVAAGDGYEFAHSYDLQELETFIRNCGNYQARIKDLGWEPISGNSWQIIASFAESSMFDFPYVHGGFSS